MKERIATTISKTIKAIKPFLSNDDMLPGLKLNQNDKESKVDIILQFFKDEGVIANSDLKFLNNI